MWGMDCIELAKDRDRKPVLTNEALNIQVL
jgi:hypothetical protein